MKHRMPFLSALPFIVLTLSTGLVARHAAAEEPPPFKILGSSPADWATRLSNSETLNEQRLAVYCLGEFGPAAREAVPVLRATVRETRYDEVRCFAVEALGLVGSDAAPAVGELLAVLADEKNATGLRCKALEAVARIAPENPEVVKAVLRAVASPVVELRQTAFDAAVTVAVSNRPADIVAALARAARGNENAELATRALRCLGTDGVPALVEVLTKGEDAARQAAAENLARMGEAARPALASILKALKREKRSEVRGGILSLLAGLMPDDPEVLSLARELMGERESTKTCVRVLKQAGTAALPHIREALRTKDSDVRIAAVGICADLGDAAAPLAVDISRLIGDKNEDVRVAAADALSKIGPAAVAVHQTLQSLVDGASGRTRRAIELAAANVSRPPGSPPRRSPCETLTTERLIELLRTSPQADQRAEAAVALRERAPAGLDALIAALDDESISVRIAAAKGLAFHGAAGKAAAGKLIAWLNAPSKELQQAALAALAAIGPAAPEALDPLVQLATGPSAPDDMDSSTLLGYALRAHGVEAVVRLAPALKSGDARVVERAAHTLGKMGEMATAVHAELKAAALSTDERVVRAVIDALSELGPDAIEDVPMLVRFLSYAAPSWRRAAAEAVASIKLDFSKGDTYGVIDALLPMLLDQDPDTAWSAYLALYLIGEPALPKLRWLVTINEGEVPFPVLRVMAKLKADPATIVPKLVALCRPGNRDEEQALAAELLGLYGPEHVKDLSVLIDMLRDRSEHVVREAGEVLESFGPVAVPALEAALRGRDPVIRHQALELLERVRAAK
jgi:HEAT repeat protein